ncbi:hypothetical protein AN958_09311, partial [Leucoagaricus sp. SymC.cos]
LEMRLAVASIAVLSVASSGLAYLVTAPRTGDTWRCGDWQTISWDFVITDPTEFSIEITDQATTVMAAHRISRDSRSARVRVPLIPTSDVYRVNFVKDQQDKTILAQSGQFKVWCPYWK